MSMLPLIIGIVFIICGLYLWLTKNDNYWKKKNVTFIPPRLFVGNMGDALINKRSINTIITDSYRNFKDSPYLGLFSMWKPVLLVRHPTLVHNVLVTEFNKFHDNFFDLNEKADPILSKNVFYLKGEKWKIMRSQLSPLLTNAKIKAMFPLVEEVCKNMVKYIETTPEAIGKDGIDVKQIALKFTTDNVASCAFGLEGDSFDNPNAFFKKMMEDYFKVNIFGSLKFLIISLFPDLNKILKLSVGQKIVTDRFKNIMIEAVKYRKQSNIRRNDFLDSIIELRSKPMPFEYTDDYMVGNAFTFFLDGSETSAVVLSFALLQLAANPDIQAKLKIELDQTLENHNNNITFEAVLEMTYLDAIFNETLRKYPPLMFLTRNCTEETKFYNPNSANETVTIEKGTHIYIPVYSLHHDDQYYPNPDVFDPNRFTKEAKYPLPKNCFFGFGDGPRICLGQRFAIMQIKLAMLSIISHFKIRLNKRTKFPIELDGTTDFLSTVGGIWLNFHKRRN